MLRPLIAALALAVCTSAPLRSQTARAPEAPELPAQPDSVTTRAREQGRAAAGKRGVGGYFAASFAGGVPAGFLLPFAATGEGDLVAPWGVSVGVVVATTVAANRPSAHLPPVVAPELEHESPEYQRSFRAAYDQRLSQRRRRATARGGAVGVLTGLGALAWLVSRIDSDF